MALHVIAIVPVFTKDYIDLNLLPLCLNKYPAVKGGGMEV